MHAIQLIQEGFDHVHQALLDDIGEVASEWLFWQPASGLNHIGFLFWHLVRDEDAVVSYVTKRPELWGEGWSERVGMEGNEQGTGMAPERIDAFRYDMDSFLPYAEHVWARTGPALAELSEADLDGPAWPGSDWNVGQQLVEGCLCHSWVHLGEIRSLMGQRGWKFRE
jgi:hypothetical protein